MTAEELLKARQEMVHHMFSCEGDEFISLVKKNCRPGVLAITEEMKEKLHAEEYKWNGYTWWKLGKGSIPKGKTKKVLYIHGGGWVIDSGITQYMFAEYLVDHLGCEVWFPEYPIIPEGDGLTALEMVTDLYTQMLQECDSSEIAIGGDSAGGGLALSLAEHIRETGLSGPNTLLLVSPGLFECVNTRNAEEKEYAEYTSAKDPIVSLNAFPTVLQYWKGDLDESDYRINPARGVLKGLPTTLVFCGGYECMEKGIRSFVENAVMQDVEIRYYMRNHKTHNYVLSDPDAEGERGMIVARLLDPDKC